MRSGYCMQSGEGEGAQDLSPMPFQSNDTCIHILAIILVNTTNGGNCVKNN